MAYGEEEPWWSPSYDELYNKPLSVPIRVEPLTFKRRSQRIRTTEFFRTTVTG